MFASFLKLFGFPRAQPVHSRAGEKQQAAEPTAPAPPSPSVNKKSARRPTVKVPTVKASASIRKSTETPSLQGVSKSAAVVKKAKTKDVVPTPVPVAAPASKKAPVKTKAVAPKAAVTAPAGAPVVQPIAKPAKVKTVRASSLPPSPSESVPVSTKTKIAAAPAAPETMSPAKTAPAEADLLVTGVPVRSTRPSSRLAQLTVPSIAQTVASTAAKASFSQITTVAPIASPLPSAIKKDSKLANNWKKKSVAELTDAEVLAMADNDYMNETQLAFFRLKLVTLKNSMLSNAGETTEHLREETVVVPDPADRATIEEEHALELRTRDRERKLLKKIEQSITRIDSGDYGYCDETGEPIGVGRLLARPTASLSLEAQQRRELKQKMFGD